MYKLNYGIVKLHDTNSQDEWIAGYKCRANLIFYFSTKENYDTAKLLCESKNRGNYMTLYNISDVIINVSDNTILKNRYLIEDLVDWAFKE